MGLFVGCANVDLGPKTITINGDRIVQVGKTIQLSAIVAPEGAVQTVTWSSARADIAAVSTSGVVTGVKVGATVITATSTEDASVTGQVRITVELDPTAIQRPDLGGYTIRIAQAAHALQEIDPFHELYIAQNRVAKQQAWTWVEEQYNCQIEVVAYPADAEWGLPRWNYILQQAASGVADYDFYTVPDSEIGRFVEGNAIIDVSGWYAAYGQNFMDAVYQSAGTYKGNLYSITDGESGIYNVMYYNINLLDQLGMDKTPAEMFNDGEWTFSGFQTYAIEAQTKLNGLGGGLTRWAVAGSSPFYWVGMANAGGVKLADVASMTLNIKHPISIAAADTLKAIRLAGAMDPARLVDQNVTSWMDGRALFSSGDLWFVNTSNRWPENLWGEGDATKYGYVPFPRPDGTLKADQQIGLGGTATFVMPIGRDYTGFGSDCTAENIYRAMIETFQKTREYRLADPDYDAEAALRTYAERYTESEDSVVAFMYIASRTKTIGFYEPLSTQQNPIVAMDYSTFVTSVNNFVMGTIATFAEAVDPLIPILQENMTKAFS